MIEYRIQKEGKKYAVYNNSSGELISNLTVSGFFRKKITTDQYKLISGTFTKSRWKIKEDKITLSNIKITDQIDFHLLDENYFGEWYKNKKFQMKSDKFSKIVFTIDKSRTKLNDTIIVEDAEHIDPSFTILLSVLVMLKWLKRFEN